MPVRRSARRRNTSAEGSSALAGGLKTMKSLPRPCILVNDRRMGQAYVVKRDMSQLRKAVVTEAVTFRERRLKLGLANNNATPTTARFVGKGENPCAM